MTRLKEAFLIWLMFAAMLATAGCGGESDGEPEGAASELHARLMTGEQYAAALSNVFGRDIAESVVAPLPPMPRVDGLVSSGAASVALTSDQLQQLYTAAATVAAKVTDATHRDYLIPCKPENADGASHACATKFLEHVGRLWFRRPMVEAKLEEYVAIADSAADELGDFYDGLALALEGMLVSPEALLIVDRAEPHPDNLGELRLDAYSLASRLSFFLWNAPPDDALLDAAENGDLYRPQERARIVDAMLASPRLEDGVRAFFEDMLHFDEFNSLSKSPTAYPAVTGATLVDAREQTLRTIYDHLIRDEHDYRDLFTTRETFVSMNLSPIYGVPASESSGWKPYTFPEDGPRVGLLTHASFLTAHAHPARSSPTLRGKALREIFLCQTVPDPPPNVDFSDVENPDPSLRTARQRLEAHNSNPACAGCHKIMDPIGLALEHFDGAGQYRETQGGAPIKIDGDLDGAIFTDVEGLAKALHDHPSLPTCLVERVYAYAVGGPLSGRIDWPITDYFAAKFAESGYRFPALLKTIAVSDAFSKVRKLEPPTEASEIARLRAAEGPSG